MLQNINREIVAPESIAEYERLQLALKRTERAEVRYRVVHPELGQRWLLTRVEPATLASGKRTASVVTLDVTDQHISQRRSEQLLREMTTILESTTAGIAYLRGGALVRCNRRFETMLRLPPSAVVGSSLAELLAGHPQAEATAAEIREALIADAVYETEFAFTGFDDLALADTPIGDPHDTALVAPRLRWYALSVRRAGGALGFDEAIAVLYDVTRMKLQQVQLESLALERELMAERTRSILDSVLVGIVTVGARGIEWMNRSARRMFGGELVEFIGEPMAVVATADADHPFRRTRYLDELVEGAAETFECQVCARDGRQFWIVGNVVATGREGSGRQLTFALLDIERRRQAEAAVSTAQASLRRVIEAAPLAIALLDARTFRSSRPTPSPRRRSGARPTTCSARRSRRCSPSDLAAARRARHAGRARRERGDDARVPLQRATASRASGTHACCRWSRCRASRPTSCCSSPPTSPSSARRRRRASRRRSRSARCWSRKSITGSRTTCRASPGCSSRSPAGSPRSPRRSTRSSARCRRSPRSTGCRSAPTGRCRSSACSRRSPARCSEPSAGRSAAASPAPAPPSGRCPRSRRSRSR